MATLEDFQRLDIRTARIIAATIHPNAERLLVLRVSLGTEERQIVAGIRASYAPEQLVGRTAIVVANLDAATIRGVESQGMLLAAKDESGMSILSADREILPGSHVK